MTELAPDPWSQPRVTKARQRRGWSFRLAVSGLVVKALSWKYTAKQVKLGRNGRRAWNLLEFLESNRTRGGHRQLRPTSAATPWRTGLRQQRGKQNAPAMFDANTTPRSRKRRVKDFRAVSRLVFAASA
jgi:hypothetical protein